MAYVMLYLLLLSVGSEGFRLASKTAAAPANASLVDGSLQGSRDESSCRCKEPNNCTPNCICDCCTGECVLFPPPSRRRTPTPPPPGPTPPPATIGPAPS